MNPAAIAFLHRMFVSGYLIMLGTIGVLLFGDVYQEGRVGSPWFAPQIGAAIIMVYAGGLGRVLAVATPRNAGAYNMSAFWIPFGVFLFLLAWSIWFFAPEAAHVPPSTARTIVSFIAWSTIFLAFTTAFVATHCAITVHTMRARHG